MAINQKQIYGLNNMNVAAKNILLGTEINNLSGSMIASIDSGDAITYQFDIHFLKDSLGSRTEFIK